MSNSKSGVFLGINLMMDPSVAIVREGEILAYSEEERHVRIKHAPGLYPVKALRYCLEAAGVSLEEVEAVGINWDIEAYTNGKMKDFYESLRKKYPADEQTLNWQSRNLKMRNRDVYRESHEYEWRRLYGNIHFPPIHTLPHHYVHAFQAYRLSPFDEAICLTMDGSGDSHCTVIWKCQEERIVPLREFTMPHSLGWYYAAFTEYLGFEAYDGEYKVMGLAAYGKHDDSLYEKVSRILTVFKGEGRYEVDPTYLHYGQHTYSKRFTDKLAELFGKPPRRPGEETTRWHQNLAFCVQKKLEECAFHLVSWAIKETGIRNICIGGGVGLNVKMNGRLLQMPQVESLYGDPLCADCGAAVGAALATCCQVTGKRPQRMETLALGYHQTEKEIESILCQAQAPYTKVEDICHTLAEDLANGKIVGWFQGRMEAGPRALGQRSILADPRFVEIRDKVNTAIKFREEWRPFCPSIMAEYMGDYFDKYVEAPFMNLSFPCNEKLKKAAPAIVHVDGTARVQMVRKEANPLFHKLLSAFKTRTGVPVLLNTSFNLQGEPMVCNAYDALRTFWSSGLDVLALGNFIIRKNFPFCSLSASSNESKLSAGKDMDENENSRPFTLPSSSVKTVKPFSAVRENLGRSFLPKHEITPGQSLRGSRLTSEGFTIEWYCEIVREFLRNQYRITDFLHFSPYSRHLILRHDIDMDPDSASGMAKAEADMNVEATYFVLLRSELYNPFSPRSQHCLREILAMGHAVGLHFDASLYSDRESLAAACASECELLEKMLGKKIEVISFHKPAKEILAFEERIAARRHTYQPIYFSEAGYCSDSKGGWFHGHPLSHPAFREGRGMQLLTHPIWWDSEPGEGPLKRLDRLIDDKTRLLKETIAHNCQPYRKHLNAC